MSRRCPVEISPSVTTPVSTMPCPFTWNRLITRSCISSESLHPQLADGAAPGVELLLHYRAHFFGRRAGGFEGLVVELGAHVGPAQDEVGLARQALDDFLRRPGRCDERDPGVDGKRRQARF